MTFLHIMLRLMHWVALMLLELQTEGKSFKLHLIFKFSLLLTNTVWCWKMEK